MNRMAIFLIFLNLFCGSGHLSAQGLSARVLESAFIVYPKESGQGMISSFKLDQDSLYKVLESAVKQALNLQTISSAQPTPFIFTKRKNKNYKQLSSADSLVAKVEPADLYLIFLLTADPPYPSMISNHLIKTAVTFEVFIYDRSFQRIESLKVRKRQTGITSDPGDEYGYMDDLSFFDLERESFLHLFDRALNKMRPGK